MNALFRTTRSIPQPRLLALRRRVLSRARGALALLAVASGPGVSATFAGLENGLVGHWFAPESNGSSVVDSSVNANHGEANGSTWTDRKGGAMSFDGADDYVTIPHLTKYLLDKGAVAFWVKPRVISSHQGLFTKDAVGNGNGGHLKITLEGSKVAARLQSHSKSYSVSKNSAAQEGQWLHVVLLFGNDEILRLYLNGSLAASNSYKGGLGTSSGGSGNTEPIALGADTQSSQAGKVTPLADHLNGLLADVRLYDRRLSQAEITALHNLGKDSDDDDLSDVLETARGFNPNSSDGDSDGLSDYDEFKTHGTSPVKKDTDDDNVSDPVELLAGTDPKDAASVPTFNTSLVGRWAMLDSNFSRLEDHSFIENNGTLRNFDSTPRSVEGPRRSLFFDGEDDFVEIPHVAPYLADEGVITAWFKPGVTNRSQSIFSKDSSGSDTGGHLDVWLDKRRIKARLQGKSDEKTLDTNSTAVTAGQWNHVAVRWGSAGFRLYHNGKLVDEDDYPRGLGSTSGGAGNHEPFVIGASTGGSGNLVATPTGWRFRGHVAEVRFYARPLEDSEILALYQQDKDSDHDGLPDHAETQAGSNPNDPDSDDDSLSDVHEVRRYGTNPNKADTDDDNVTDDLEILTGSNPLDANSTPNRHLGLAGHWTFDEGNTTHSPDASSGSNVALLRGQAALDGGGVIGKALKVNGEGSYAELAHLPAYLAENGGVSLWVKADQASLSNEKALFSKDANGYGNGGHLILYLDGGKPKARLQSKNASYFAAASNKLPANVWTHLVVVWGKGQLKLYVGGQEAGGHNFEGGLGPTSAGTGNVEPIAVGAGTGASSSGKVTPAGNFFSGLIDDLRFYNRRLLPSDVDELRNLGLDNDGDGLSNTHEAERGTNPQAYDTDQDGLTDGAEVHQHNTDPTRADTDGDGLRDEDELTAKTNPRDPDSDDDFLSDGEEITAQTNPLDSDSDDDGFLDGFEAERNTDPKNAQSFSTDLVFTDGNLTIDTSEATWTHTAGASGSGQLVQRTYDDNGTPLPYQVATFIFDKIQLDGNCAVRLQGSNALSLQTRDGGRIRIGTHLNADGGSRQGLSIPGQGRLGGWSGVTKPMKAGQGPGAPKKPVWNGLGAGYGSAAQGQAYGDPLLTHLLGGSSGSSSDHFPSGSGGGAIELKTAGVIRITSTGILSAVGGHSTSYIRGGGGGSGGAVRLEGGHVFNEGLIDGRAGKGKGLASGGRVAFVSDGLVNVGEVKAHGRAESHDWPNYHAIDSMLAYGAVALKPTVSEPVGLEANATQVVFDTDLAQWFVNDSGLRGSGAVTQHVYRDANDTAWPYEVCTFTFRSIKFHPSAEVILRGRRALRLVTTDGGDVEIATHLNANAYNRYGASKLAAVGKLGGFDGVATGKKAGKGPGAPPGGEKRGAGGGYGNSATAGKTYGDPLLTHLLGGSSGSSGEHSSSGAGGGAIAIEAGGNLLVTATGKISANGSWGSAYTNGGGGGSGGSVLLKARSITNHGEIQALSGGGENQAGGGRIALVYAENLVQGDIDASGGQGKETWPHGVDRLPALAGTITLRKLNEAPAALSLTHHAVAENLPAGSLVGRLLVSDPDANDTHRLALVPDANGSSLHNHLFAIDANGSLRSTAPLDHEQNATRKVHVRASDEANASIEKTFVITIRDDDSEDADKDGLTQKQETALGSSDLKPDTDGDGYADKAEAAAGSDPTSPFSIPNRPPDAIFLSAHSLLENLPAGSLVGHLLVSDPDDALGNDAYRLSLVPDANGSSLDNVLFAIDANGSLRSATTFDHEQNATRKVHVRASDEANASIEKTFVIHVRNTFAPVVRTLPLGDGSALSGKVLADGDNPILEVGIVLSRSLFLRKTDPSTQTLPAAKLAHDFSLTPANLEAGATYYFRAYARNAEGITYGARQRLRTPAAAKPDPWAGALVLQAGWRNLPWFGAFLPYDNGWLYHADLGWLYRLPATNQTDGFWLWNEKLGWVWTKEGLYPHLWRHQTGGWIYFAPAIRGPNKFYDQTGGEWFGE